MKTVTNYQAGARGVNLKNGTTVWVEPGQTVDIEGEIAGDLPDFGKKPSDDAAADQAASDAALAAAKSEIDAMNADLTAKDATIADLTAQLEAATAPATKK